MVDKVTGGEVNLIKRSSVATCKLFVIKFRIGCKSVCWFCAREGVWWLCFKVFYVFACGKIG